MSFSRFEPCVGTASFCGEHILGIGVITESTASELLALKPGAGQDLYLHSPGGSLVGGLALGYAIRSLRLDTVVGGPYEMEDRKTDELVTLVEESSCASSCAYAFLGGQARTVEEERALLFHQFYSETGKGDLSVTQDMVAALLSYFDAMSVDRKGLDAALSTHPGQLSYLSHQELTRLKIHFQGGFSESRDASDALDWKVLFSPDRVPYLEADARTNRNKGDLTLKLWMEEEKVKLQLSVLWDKNIPAQELGEVFSIFQAKNCYDSKAKAMIPCENSDYLIHIVNCASASTCPTIATADSRIILGEARQWILPVALDFSSLEKVATSSDPNLKFFTCVPNVYIEYDFCPEIPVTRRLIELLSLLRAAGAEVVKPKATKDETGNWVDYFRRLFAWP
jgi:hypothetical protein